MCESCESYVSLCAYENNDDDFGIRSEGRSKIAEHLYTSPPLVGLRFAQLFATRVVFLFRREMLQICRRVKMAVFGGFMFDARSLTEAGSWRASRDLRRLASGVWRARAPS